MIHLQVLKLQRIKILADIFIILQKWFILWKKLKIGTYVHLNNINFKYKLES